MHSNFTCASSASTRTVVVFSMSRSGTSLATSLIAGLLGQDGQTWRGSGKAYPTDLNNRFGYYERADVVRLNYQILAQIGYRSWTAFEANFSNQPRALDPLRLPKDIWTTFESRAAPIVKDMAKRGRDPFVLKDVRFSRTVPLWAPVFRRYAGAQMACVIPFRKPAEVALSSRMPVDRVQLWRNFMLAALASAHAIGCPVMLLEYDRWIASGASASKQFDELLEFLRCAGVRVTTPVDRSLLAKLIRPEEKHRSADMRAERLVPSRDKALYEELQNGLVFGRMMQPIDSRRTLPGNRLQPRAHGLLSALG